MGLKKLKILQLASFEGNIGDNANHNGTRKLLRRNLRDFDLEFDNLEIRDFFWKHRHYDQSFADQVNEYDLLIVGGGNFFEMWVDDSCNGTSVDISIELLQLINPPIIFYALGVDPAQGVSDERLDKFRTWLDYVFSQKKYLVSVRNDGALEAAHEFLGKDYADKMHHVSDGGFFTEVGDFVHTEIPENSKVIGVNLAGDMLEVRFPNDTDDGITYEEFLSGLASTLEKLMEEDDSIHVVFYPHIHKDFSIISDFLRTVKDSFARKRITVGPYLHGEGAQEYIFDGYRKCDLIMGNRFHTNVCAIGLGVPSIGFVNYRQIEKLYQELEMEDRMIYVNRKGFEDLLYILVKDTLGNSEEIRTLYAQKKEDLESEVTEFHGLINKWLLDYV